MSSLRNAGREGDAQLYVSRAEGSYVFDGRGRNLTAIAPGRV
jgi:hypothetical protein